MRRLAHPLLVFCTALAAFVASSLHGNVLCYADSGGHVAVEAPHADTGCPGGHEEHRESSSGHESRRDHCTDVSPEFSAAREAKSPSTIAHHSELEIAPALLPVLVAHSVDLPVKSRESGSHPPAAPQLDCLRTIILLV
jgi:hypothetical protein